MINKHFQIYIFDPTNLMTKNFDKYSKASNTIIGHSLEQLNEILEKIKLDQDKNKKIFVLDNPSLILLENEQFTNLLHNSRFYNLTILMSLYGSLSSHIENNFDVVYKILQ